jgi:hypothetical protein
MTISDVAPRTCTWLAFPSLVYWSGLPLLVISKIEAVTHDFECKLHVCTLTPATPLLVLGIHEHYHYPLKQC